MESNSLGCTNLEALDDERTRPLLMENGRTVESRCILLGQQAKPYILPSDRCGPIKGSEAWKLISIWRLTELRQDKWAGILHAIFLPSLHHLLPSSNFARPCFA